MDSDPKTNIRKVDFRTSLALIGYFLIIGGISTQIVSKPLCTSLFHKPDNAICQRFVSETAQLTTGIGIPLLVVGLIASKDKKEYYEDFQ